MGKQKNLGEFEILVLAALIRLGADAYGVTIRREIEERANRSVSIGALYSTLARMEEKGYIGSRVGEATPERGGRAKTIITQSKPKAARSLKNLRRPFRACLRESICGRKH